MADIRFTGFFCLFTGDHLCEVCAEMYGPGPTSRRAELPCHFYPPSDDTGREVCSTLCGIFIRFSS